MRYIMLIYSPSPERDLNERHYEPHWALMEEAGKTGALVAAEPLPPTSVTKTVRPNAMITDGPFVETKEQLAGYYIFDCRTQDEALMWAQKIFNACGNASAVEVRPLPGVPERPKAASSAHDATR